VNYAIGVLIPTFRRPAVLRRSLALLAEYLRYTGGPLRVLVSSDDPLDGTREMVAELSSLQRDDFTITYLDGPRQGLGANLNFLLQASETDLWLQMDDDHLLLAPLSLDRHADHLLTHPEDGWIRLMLGEWCSDPTYYYRFEAANVGSYWRISWRSQEPYVASNRPHLKHRRFHEHYGMYPQGLKLYETEIQFCARCKEIGLAKGGPHVLIPMYLEPPETWDHGHDSWQDRGF